MAEPKVSFTLDPKLDRAQLNRQMGQLKRQIDKSLSSGIVNPKDIENLRRVKKQLLEIAAIRKKEILRLQEKQATGRLTRGEGKQLGRLQVERRIAADALMNTNNMIRQQSRLTTAQVKTAETNKKAWFQANRDIERARRQAQAGEAKEAERLRKIREREERNAIRTRLAEERRSIHAMEAARRASLQRIRDVASLALGGGAFFAGRRLLEDNREFEKAIFVMKNALGTTEAATTAFSRVKELTKEIGGDLRGASFAYAQFAASTKNTALEGEQTFEIFRAISKQAAVTGASVEDFKGVFRAVRQIATKGKVQAEELVGQLGERIPGALERMAAGLGVTRQALFKMMEEGKLAADVALPALTKAINETVSDKEARDNARTIQGTLNNLQTKIFEFSTAIGESGFNAAFKDLISLLGVVLDILKPFGMLLAGLFRAATLALKPIIFVLDSFPGKILLITLALLKLRSVIESLGVMGLLSGLGKKVGTLTGAAGAAGGAGAMGGAIGGGAKAVLTRGAMFLTGPLGIALTALGGLGALFGEDLLESIKQTAIFKSLADQGMRLWNLAKDTLPNLAQIKKALGFSQDQGQRLEAARGRLTQILAGEKSFDTTALRQLVGGANAQGLQQIAGVLHDAENKGFTGTKALKFLDDVIKSKEGAAALRQGGVTIGQMATTINVGHVQDVKAAAQAATAGHLAASFKVAGVPAE